MSCKNCEKLKDALISLVGESDVKNLKVMKEYLYDYLNQNLDQNNQDAEISLFAINTLIEVLEEEQMKIREGFVSNSSSSSFIVISHDYNELLPSIPEVLTFSHSLRCGTSEFGWEEYAHNDFYSKFNFCVIQASYIPEKFLEYWFMLENVMNSIGVTIEYDVEVENTYAYIDHQSASYEGENMEMFESEENLKNFLFNKNSYIQTGNDNG